MAATKRAGLAAEINTVALQRLNDDEFGLAQRQGQRVVFARDLLNTLRRRELGCAVAKLSIETGLVHHPSVSKG